MITVFVVVFWFSIGMSLAMGAIGWALLRWKDLVTFWVMMITLRVVRGVLAGGRWFGCESTNCWTGCWLV